jgi:hypothetical protein
MRVTLFIWLVFTAMPLRCAADKVQPLKVKIGLWEVTMTTNTSGQMPIPDELVARLTPDQRARIEERINARSAQPAKVITYRHCLTQEQLDKGVTFGEDHRSCTRTIVSSTSSGIDQRLECEEHGVKTDGKIHFEAINSENVKGLVQFGATGGDHTMNSSLSFVAKWISPLCGMTR